MIKHEFKVNMKTLQGQYEVIMPVIVYNMPLFPDDETIVDNLSEGNSVEIARAAENEFDLRQRI